MTPAKGIDAYYRTQVESRTPLELVVMLYDGAIGFALQARDAVLRRDIPARRKATSRALAFLSELQCSLDLERGQHVASKLDGLYVFISQALVNGAIGQDARKIDDAIRVLRTLRDAWAEIAKKAAQQNGNVAA